MTTALLTPTPAAMAEQIAVAATIVIIYGSHESNDASFAAQVLAAGLQAQGKAVSIVSANPAFPELPFFPNAQPVSSELALQQRLVIQVPLQDVAVEEVSYDSTDTHLHIAIVPKTGTLNPELVTAKNQGTAPQLLISLGVNKLEDLGSLYSQQAEVFTNTPRFSLSINSTNSYSGTWNWGAPSAQSYAELVLPLCDALGIVISPDLATLLLAGLASVTQNFQSPTTSSDSLELAAKLVALGAQYANAVNTPQKTKPFAEIKLWGRALARMTPLSDTLLYTALSSTDLQKTELHTDSIPAVLRNIVEQVPDYHAVCLTTETENGVTLWCASKNQEHLDAVAALFDQSQLHPASLYIDNYSFASFDIPNGTQLAVEAALRDFAAHT